MREDRGMKHWLALAAKAMGATVRHGPVKVLAFVQDKRRERGLRWVVRYALADETARRALRAGEALVVEAGGVAIGQAEARRIEAAHSAIATAPPPSTALGLDQNYSIDALQWDRYMGPLFVDVVHRPLSRLSSPISPRLCIVAEGDVSDKVRLTQTLEAMERVAAAADYPVMRRLVGAVPHKSLPSGVGMVAASRREAIADLQPSDYVLWIRIGDAPRPELSPALKLHARPGVDFITFDGYFFDQDRVHPVFLPGANPIHAMNVDYFFSRFLVRVGVLTSRDLTDADEALVQVVRNWLKRRPSDTVEAGWRHVAAPLMHLELSLDEIARLRQVKLAADAKCELAATGRNIRRATVSIVICTKDKGHLLRQLVRSCLETGRSRIADVIVVSNNTTNFFARETLDELQTTPKVKVLRYDAPFNFSAQSNLGARAGTGEFVLMLNDDIAPVTANWLELLLEPFADPRVGITAPLLLYPNEKVQHAGMYLGLNACAGHLLRFAKLPEQDYLFYASAPREVSCLTAAVALVSRECFDALNGFDELLATFLQDVDLCLRAKNSGFKNVFVPASRLLHMESTSVVDHIANHEIAENRGREHAYFFHRWKHLLTDDPFHNPNFDVADESLHSLRPRPAAAN